MHKIKFLLLMVPNKFKCPILFNLLHELMDLYNINKIYLKNIILKN